MLCLVCLAQALWILASRESSPSLERIITATPIGRNSAVYEVLGAGAGATTGATYFYFIHEKVAPQSQLLALLEPQSAFLVTRQSRAVVGVDGTRVSVQTHDTVYRYSSLTVLHEDGRVTPIVVQLDSRMDQPAANEP